MLHATETAKIFYKIVNIFYTIIFSANIFYTANNFYKSKLFLQYLFILFILVFIKIYQTNVKYFSTSLSYFKPHTPVVKT